MNNQDNKWVLITGGAKRIGAEVARTLHARGMNLAVHYNSSNQDAESLSNELNGIRANSTLIFGANLTSDNAVEGLIPDVLSKTGRLDVLINNASTFYPTAIDDITHDDWDSTQNGDDQIDDPFDARALKSMKRSDVAHAGMSIRTNSDEEDNLEEKALRLLNEKLG